MIGEAEIQELMCEYAEALKKEGLEPLLQAPSWPLTLPTTADEAGPVSVMIAAMFRWPFMPAAEGMGGGAVAADGHRTQATRT